MSILIPLDGKPHSQRAVDLVREICNLAEADITLLHVLQTDDERHLGAKRRAELDKSLDASMRTLLESVAEPLRAACANVSIRIESGHPLAVIKAAAYATRATLVVMAPEKHSPKELLISGSITQQFLHSNWDGTLLLARPDLPNATKLVLLLDGSQEGFASLKRLLPMFTPQAPVLVAASQTGVSQTQDKFWFSLGQGSDGLKTQTLPKTDLAAVLAESKKVCAELARESEMVEVESPFEEWLEQTMKTNPPKLLVTTRLLKDTLRPPLTKSNAEAIFLGMPCSTALSCFKSEPF